MTLVLGHALVAYSLPDHLARLLVDAIENPSMRTIVFDRGDLMIDPDLQAVFLLVADRSGQKNTIPPDDRTGMSETGDRGLPFQVF